MGEVHYGTLSLSNLNSVSIGSYGNGELPIISGGFPIDSTLWTSSGPSNIFSADLSSLLLEYFNITGSQALTMLGTTPSALWIIEDATPQQLPRARYPNGVHSYTQKNNHVA